jgi:hypothetical protein
MRNTCPGRRQKSLAPEELRAAFVPKPWPADSEAAVESILMRKCGPRTAHLEQFACGLPEMFRDRPEMAMKAANYKANRDDLADPARKR